MSKTASVMGTAMAAMAAMAAFGLQHSCHHESDVWARPVHTALTMPANPATLQRIDYVQQLEHPVYAPKLRTQSGAGLAVHFFRHSATCSGRLGTILDFLRNNASQ